MIRIARKSLCGAVAAALVVPLGLAGPGAAADRPTAPDKGGVGPRSPSATAPALASGIIVQTKDAGVSGRLRAATESLTDAQVVRTSAVFDDLQVVRLDTPVPLVEAEQIADELELRSDVVSAEPDLILTAQSASPVPRNDELFPVQFGVWDARATYPGTSVALPYGGYSVKAPSLWRATTGKSSVRVAVIDTGITSHPDLAGRTVAGYDFRTENEPDGPRDGQVGRDADPSDPGDWRPVANYCGTPEPDEPDDPAEASSWHGTHVAGIIAAKADNGIGIVGIASGVKVQPIRVLGACGGSTSDIAAAIVWASGGSVSGVPANKTRSKVINLSLGHDAPCGSTFGNAIKKARANGSVVVAAAGNGSTADETAPIGTPANCPGVVAVTATDELGMAAIYSNLGTSSRAATIAAPGGDQSVAQGTAIWSTVDAGLTVPVAAGYAEYQGTSMAAPAVAAGAGLLSSLGYDRTEIETALRKAVRKFPRYVVDDENTLSPYNCTVRGCGAGILDLSKVPAPTKKPVITGTAKKGKTLKVTTSWIGSPSKYTYQWYRGGKKISKATKSSYKLTTSDRGKRITVKVSGKKTGFRTLSSISPSRKVAK